MIVTLRRSLRDDVEGIGNVLRKDRAIGFKKRTDIRRERFDGFVYD
jgi:hypothetical protein